jgi:chromosome segregation ATPase
VTTQSWDRIAYILIGERYGALTLNTAVDSFEYDFYTEFCEQLEQRIASYESRVTAHNANVASYNAALQAYDAEVAEYNEAVEEYNQNPTESEYLRLVNWFNQLSAQEQWLDAWAQQIHVSYLSLSQEFIELGFQRDSLGGVLGTVKEVEMYW